MTLRPRHVALKFAILTVSGALFVSAPASGYGQSEISVRELPSGNVKSTDSYGLILGVRPIAGGKLLVNDGERRQLIVLDAGLTNRTVVLDSVPTINGYSYGTRAAPLIRFAADSSLIADITSRSLLVIDPFGMPTRIASLPKSDDIYNLVRSGSGVDARGNLVYRGSEPMINDRTRNIKGDIQPPDSAPIIRANFEARTVDTIGRVKLKANVRSVTVREGERYITTRYVNPLIYVDEWAVLTDGTAAIVRGQDYHVDFVAGDGTMTSGPKLPFDWKRLSDADKRALIDSAKREREKVDSTIKALPRNSSAMAVLSAGGTVSAAALQAERNGLVVENKNTTITTEVQAGEIADYWPPLRTGAVLADGDNNLWILPATSAQSKLGELVYDVVNRKGVMMYRVRLPLDKAIAGFGPHGTVYLMEKNQWWLEIGTHCSTAKLIG